MFGNPFLNTHPNIWLQQFMALSPVMKLFSFAGNEEFFLLLLPLFYLCIHRAAGLRLGAILLCSDAFNLVFKAAFVLPRPYWIDSNVRALSTDTSFGMPSSHAQNAAAIWGYLAHRKRSVGAVLGALILVLGISVSRVFLGVHFLGDVVVGAVLGGLWLAIFLVVQSRATRFWCRQTLGKQIGLATVLALTLFVLWLVATQMHDYSRLQWRGFVPEATTAKAICARVGALWGLLVGAALASRFARFEVSAVLGKRALCFGFALLGIGVIWKGLAMVESALPTFIALIWRSARYALLTLWVTYFAPRLLLRWGYLTAREQSGVQVLAGEL